MPLSESNIVAAKVNGDEYDTLPPNVSGSGAGGDGGVATKITSTNLLDGVAVSRYNAGVFGSTVIDGDDTSKAVGSATFAKNTQNPIGKLVSLTVANVPSLTRSIHKIETYRTRKLTSAIRAGKWNNFAGEFEAGFPENVTDVVLSDNAASPSRQYPGSLVYKGGAPLAVSKFYGEKTG